MPKTFKANGKTLRVRMYRVGFGDCFLVSLPTKTRVAHILVDCGVHSHNNPNTINEAVADLQSATGGRLDIVIASHAHQDHISGFGTCKDAFSQMSIGEVWLPWTEDPTDAQATRIRKKQMALVDSLRMHFAAHGASNGLRQQAQHMLANLNLASNDTSMRLLKSGINGGKVRYLEAGDNFTDAGQIDGLTIKILGPPRDKKFLARMDPPAGDRFLRMGGGNGAADEDVRPFPGWTVKRGDLPVPLQLDAQDEAALHGRSLALEGLAFTIDQAMNNSSIVALMSFGGQHLLFPGDAQYGNWAAWLDGQDAADILSQVTFFKVAHHGSHNATPRRALDGMTDGKVAAMVSTQVKPWDTIPRGPLIKAIDAKTKKRWVRSDTISVPGGVNQPKVDDPPGFTKGRLWYDYAAPVR
jgi:beta-lactamase superfamily II metal-dependent hydrolase